jgi:hypothetical protein
MFRANEIHRIRPTKDGILYQGVAPVGRPLVFAELLGDAGENVSITLGIGDKKTEAFGSGPHYEFPTFPPQYTLMPGTKLESIGLDSAEGALPSLFSTLCINCSTLLGPQILMVAESLSPSKLIVPIEALRTFGIQSGRLELWGGGIPFLDENMVESEFDIQQLGKLTLSFPDNHVEVDGIPKSLRLNGQEMLSRRIADWPWYVQLAFGSALTMLLRLTWGAPKAGQGTGRNSDSHGDMPASDG